MRGFNGDGLYAVVTPADALPVTMVTSNIPTAARTSAAPKAKKKICAASLILKTAPRNKKLWLVPVEAISAPAMVLDHPGTHSSKKTSLIVVSPCMEWLLHSLWIEVPFSQWLMLAWLMFGCKNIWCHLQHCLWESPRTVSHSVSSVPFNLWGYPWVGQPPRKPTMAKQKSM